MPDFVLKQLYFGRIEGVDKQMLKKNEAGRRCPTLGGQQTGLGFFFGIGRFFY